MRVSVRVRVRVRVGVRLRTGTKRARAPTSKVEEKFLASVPASCPHLTNGASRSVRPEARAASAARMSCRYWLLGPPTEENG